MKLRLLTAAALVGALAFSVAGAEAGTAVLDGKKVKTLTMVSTPTAQDNDADFVTGQTGGPERVACAAPRCARLPFVFKPAKGVKGNLAFTIQWSLPVEDYDLYVAEIAKDGSASQIETCGTFAGTSEKVELSSDTFKSGKTYALIVDFYRVTGAQKVTSTVSFPGSAGIKSTVPAQVDDLQTTNCGL